MSSLFSSSFTPDFSFSTYRKNSFPNYMPGTNSTYSKKHIFTKERPEIFSLVAIGEPIVDIISDIDQFMINKFNLKFGDTILIDENPDNPHIKFYEELEKLTSVSYIPGGSIQNTMRVLSWCLNMDPETRKHFKVSMLGALGEDSYKIKILNALKDIGVYPILETLKDDKTSRCGVGVYKKEKLFVTQIRASKKLSEKFVEEQWRQITEHQALLIEGYMISKKFEICKRLCEHFRSQNKLIVLTLSAPFIIKLFNNELIEIANEADIIAGNMEEAIELANTGDNSKEKIFENIFNKFKPKQNRLLIITDGPNGVYCSQYDYMSRRMDFIYQFFAPKIKDELIRDFNGAGDAFLGGFLSQYMKGNSIENCAKIGIEAATVIIKNIGCTFKKEYNFL